MPPRRRQKELEERSTGRGVLPIAVVLAGPGAWSATAAFDWLGMEPLAALALEGGDGCPTLDLRLARRCWAFLGVWDATNLGKNLQTGAGAAFWLVVGGQEEEKAGVGPKRRPVAEELLR